MNVEGLLNRPMVDSDLAAVEKNPAAAEIRDLVRRYRAAALPVMNGGFAYSNLLEGNDQILTCLPYRLWEYASVLEGLAGRQCASFADVGGAGSPMPYWLAERGLRGTAIDLQPLLVALCNHVAQEQKLPLRAVAGDVTRDFDELHGQFDLITCISVIEHIPPAVRRMAFARMLELLKPGGLLYLTFDYGTYSDDHSYVQDSAGNAGASSIPDAIALAAMLRETGFAFLGNDPAELPADLLAQQSSPGAHDVLWHRTMNIGPIDAATPWRTLGKYVIKRLFHYHGIRQSRFHQHNFFRMFLVRPRS